LDSAEKYEPLFVTNAWVERESEDGSDVTVLLNREPNKGIPLSMAYGDGLDPGCNLADQADMPLPAFTWRPVPSDPITDGSKA
jgi:hypothetical protein